MRLDRRAAAAAMTIAGFAGAAHAQTPFEDGPAWTFTGTQPGQALGTSVFTAGDVDGDGFSDLLIGSPGHDASGAADAGRVDLFLGSSGGPGGAPDWTFEGTEAGAGLGFVAGTAGDVNGDGFGDVVVGAPGADASGVDAGAVLVFHGSAGGLGPAPDLVLSGSAAGDGFGTAAGFAGDVNDDGFSDVVIGAPGPGGGRAFLHLGTASGLSPVAAWTGTTPDDGARMGAAVATVGDLDADGFCDLAVGAPDLDTALTDAGQVVVVFGGAPPSLAVDRFEGVQAGSHLGASVATAGDHDADGFADLLAGEPGFDAGSFVDLGRVLIRYGGTTGAGVPNQLGAGQASGATFGASAAGVGDVDGDGDGEVLVGAPGGAGAVRLKLGRKPSWFAHAGPGAGSAYGAAVAPAGDVDADGRSDLVVGAPGAGGGAGSVELFLGDVGPPLDAEHEVGSYQWLGESFAVVGDVDGDGYEDLAAVQRQLGEVWVFEGGPSAMGVLPDWKSDPSPADDDVVVAPAGDVDGDGYADVAVGRPQPDGAGTGFVEVHRGSGDGPTNPVAWTVAGGEHGEAFGAALNGVGDVNADGFMDLVVGAPRHGDDRGRAVLLLGSPGGLVSEAAWETVGQQDDMRLGAAVARAGDVNADGFDDVLIGAPDHDGGEKNTGKVRLYHGGAQGLAAEPAWVRKGGKKKMRFGFAVTGLADLDGDGYPDVGVGAPYLSQGQSTEGRVFVFLGEGGTLADDPAWKADGDAVGHNLGYAVADAGDVDADGFTELVVGAPSADSPDFSPWYDLGNEPPRATVWFGSASGPAESLEFIGGDTYAEGFASAVDGGDLDGDGRSDVVVGWSHAGDYDDKPNLGRIVVFDGIDGPSDAGAPRLRRLDGSAPIVHGGLAHGGGFRIELDAVNPFGPAAAAIEAEVKPAGVPFDGGGTVTGPFVDVGAEPVTLEAVVDGLPDDAWHWRVRPRFAPESSPWISGGAWSAPPVNGALLRDVRTGPPLCAAAASASTYGVGKAGAAGVPALASEPLPRLGADVVLSVTHGTPGLASSLLVGVVQASVPFDAGTLLVQPSWIAPLPAFPADGALALPVPIPVDQALCGVSVFFQVLFVDPAAAGDLGTAQSNGLAWTIGV